MGGNAYALHKTPQTFALRGYYPSEEVGNMKDIYLGIDIGSTTVKVVALDRDQTLLTHCYLRSQGQPRQTLLKAKKTLSLQIDQARIAGVGLTGSGGEPIARLIGGRHVNELIAQTRAPVSSRGADRH